MESEHQLRSEGDSGDHPFQPHCLKQGQLWQATQDHVQSGLDRLWGLRFSHLSGQPSPVFGHPDNNIFLKSEEVSCIAGISMFLVLLLDTTELSLAPSYVDPPISYLYASIRTP